MTTTAKLNGRKAPADNRKLRVVRVVVQPDPIAVPLSRLGNVANEYGPGHSFTVQPVVMWDDGKGDIESLTDGPAIAPFAVAYTELGAVRERVLADLPTWEKAAKVQGQ